MELNKRKNKVLVVEDDSNLRKVLVSGLSQFDLEIFEAGDGEEAVAMIVDHRPYLILLDLLLPKLNGFQVLERLRQFPDNSIVETKVVVLSNLWSDKDLLRAQALKVDEYFVKSDTKLEEVFAKVHAILGSLTNTP